jgi:hypothetical protein
MNLAGISFTVFYCISTVNMRIEIFLTYEISTRIFFFDKIDLKNHILLYRCLIMDYIYLNEIFRIRIVNQIKIEYKDGKNLKLKSNFLRKKKSSLVKRLISHNRWNNLPHQIFLLFPLDQTNS